MAERRHNRQARLSDEANEGIEALLDRHGVTWAGLLEALGRKLSAEGDEWLPSELIDEARRIDRERYSRRPKGD